MHIGWKIGYLIPLTGLIVDVEITEVLYFNPGIFWDFRTTGVKKVQRDVRNATELTCANVCRTVPPQCAAQIASEGSSAWSFRGSKRHKWELRFGEAWASMGRHFFWNSANLELRELGIFQNWSTKMDLVFADGVGPWLISKVSDWDPSLVWL